MKGQAPIIEEGVAAGDLYDKYGTRNPITRCLMNGFVGSAEELVSLTGASNIRLSVFRSITGRRASGCNLVRGASRNGLSDYFSGISGRSAGG